MSLSNLTCKQDVKRIHSLFKTDQSYSRVQPDFYSWLMATLSKGVERADSKAEHSFPFIVECNNVKSFNSTLPYGFMTRAGKSFHTYKIKTIYVIILIRSCILPLIKYLELFSRT